MPLLSPALSYKLITDNLPKSLERVSARADIARETKYYLDNIGKIETAEQFVSNSRLLNYAMTAFGLKDMAYAKGLVRKLLSEGVDSTSSFANRLADNRFRDFARTLDFKSFGVATTSFDRAQQGIVDRYLRQQLETTEGEQSETVRLALYFQRTAANITNTYEILADAALTKVVQTALGLSSVLSAQSLEKQSAVIAERLDIADFKDAAKLKNFIGRFIALHTLQNPQTVTLPQFQNFASVGTLSPALMQSLQNIRFRS